MMIGCISQQIYCGTVKFQTLSPFLWVLLYQMIPKHRHKKLIAAEIFRPDIGLTFCDTPNRIKLFTRPRHHFVI